MHVGIQLYVNKWILNIIIRVRWQYLKPFNYVKTNNSSTYKSNNKLFANHIYQPLHTGGICHMVNFKAEF